MKALYEVLGKELRRRHGFGMLGNKIKPVHIANALMREEHRQVGRMNDLKHLMVATAAGQSQDDRLGAIGKMLEGSNRERWGRLGEVDDLRGSVLATRVLPLLRTILATDNAALGQSPEFSSFSSPTALTVTRDVSDEHAGAFIHRLWGGHEGGERLALLDLLRDLTDPRKELAQVDDLTALLVPLADEMRDHKASPREAEDLTTRPRCAVAASLREAARDLEGYEAALKPNPIATLQRIVLLASLSIFFYTATRGHDRLGLPRRMVLLDCSGSKDTLVATASEHSVSRVMEDARDYMAGIVAEMLREQRDDWEVDPIGTFDAAIRQRTEKHGGGMSLHEVAEIVDELNDTPADLRTELPRRVSDLLGSSSRTLDGFLRLLGVRCGLLYPQQKNPSKRCVPTDRTLEALVAGTFDLSGQPLEYRDFLDRLHDRWRLVVGGRLEDADLLADARLPVPTTDLAENSDRFLERLQRIGLARKLADSVAVVGLMEGAHASD